MLFPVQNQRSLNILSDVLLSSRSYRPYLLFLSEIRRNGVPRDKQVKKAFHYAVDTSVKLLGFVHKCWRWNWGVGMIQPGKSVNFRTCRQPPHFLQYKHGNNLANLSLRWMPTADSMLTVVVLSIVEFMWVQTIEKSNQGECERHNVEYVRILFWYLDGRRLLSRSRRGWKDDTVSIGALL